MAAKKRGSKKTDRRPSEKRSGGAAPGRGKPDAPRGPASPRGGSKKRTPTSSEPREKKVAVPVKAATARRGAVSPKPSKAADKPSQKSRASRSAAKPKKGGSKHAPTRPKKGGAAPKRAVGETKKPTAAARPRTSKARKAAPPTSTKAPSRKGGKRDHAAEYRRRIERAEARGLTRAQGRGHPQRERGELSIAALQQMKRAVRADSEARSKYGPRGALRGSAMRDRAREHVADVAGVDRDAALERSTSPESREAKKFVAAFIKLGLGSRHEAYNLWFS